jgi:hypothetical protein
MRDDNQQPDMDAQEDQVDHETSLLGHAGEEDDQLLDLVDTPEKKRSSDGPRMFSTDQDSDDTDILPTPSKPKPLKNLTITQQLRLIIKSSRSSSKTLTLPLSEPTQASVDDEMSGPDSESKSASLSSKRGHDSQELHESTKGASRHKRRKMAAAMPQLDLDAIAHIMHYVGPRELLAFTANNLALRDHLTMTMVVRSAMVCGGKVHADMLNTIERNMKEAAIYVPSPYRALQLINAKRCEFCRADNAASACWYHAGHFGLFSCLECLADRLTNQVNVVWSGHRSDSRFYSALSSNRLRHQLRIRDYGCSCGPYHKIATVRFLEESVSGGEYIGPVATRRHFQKILKLCKAFPAKSISDIVDHVLRYDLASVGRIEDFVEARKAAQELADKAEDLRRQSRQQAALKAATSRLHHLQRVLYDLEQKCRVRIRDFILEYEVDDKGTIKFACPLVDKLLKRFVRAPTKVKSKDINEVAAKLNGKFKRLVQIDFLNAPFLVAEDAFDVQLKSIFQEQFPDLASVAPALTDTVFELIEKEDLVGAMMSLSGFKYNTAEFGVKILHHLADEHDTESTDVDMAKLLGAQWVKCFNQSGKEPRSAFELASRTLDRMVVKTDCFLAWMLADEATTQEFENFCREHIYHQHRLNMIERGKFDALWSELFRCFGRRNDANDAPAN